MIEDKIRDVLRRWAKPGEPIPPCSCFNPNLCKRSCNGVCEDAVENLSSLFKSELAGQAATRIRSTF